MKRKIVLMILLVGTMSLATYAQQGRKGAQGNRSGDCEKIEGLTESQKAKIQDLKKKQKAEVAKIQKDLKAERAKFREMTKGDNPNMQSAYAQIDRMAAKKAEIQKINLRYRLEKRKVLTPEQRKQWDESCRRGHNAERRDTNKNRKKSGSKKQKGNRHAKKGRN